MCTADNIYQEFIIEGAEWDQYVTKMWYRAEEYYNKFV